MARFVSDALRIMRLAISRRNTNDPDSSNETLLEYLNDFVSLTMTSDVKLFEQYGTLVFDINDATDGVYTFNDIGADSNFDTISGDGFISLADPATESLSWQPLKLYLNPDEFYDYWGLQNEDILTPGMPTEMLYYGNQLVFRTIPDDDYTVTLYGYKKHSDFSTVGNPALDYDHWLRFLAYGAALNYAKDYRYEPAILAELKKDYAYERRLMLTKTHNQIKIGHPKPSF